jgi:hypothetical protein
LTLCVFDDTQASQTVSEIPVRKKIRTLTPTSTIPRRYYYPEGQRIQARKVRCPLSTHCGRSEMRHCWRMKNALAAFAILLTCQAQAAAPKSFLASIEGIQLNDGEGIASFKLRTWGVVFQAVCHVPYDWEITAGSMGPSGRLEGMAGHGASWVRTGDHRTLRALVLITLVGGVQKTDIRHSGGVIPATFSGMAFVESGDRIRKVQLTYANVRLASAKRCPW